MGTPPVIVGVKEDDPRAWVPLCDWEDEYAVKKIYQRCLKDIAARMVQPVTGSTAANVLLDIGKRMNEMADEIERYQARSWSEDTAPAPLSGSN